MSNDYIKFMIIKYVIVFVLLSNTKGNLSRDSLLSNSKIIQ